jgi:GT2 family glycosyltransferase
MRVSVVVPSYRRPQSLARCLDALERQERDAEEIIVVIRAGDVASHELARARPVRVVVVRRQGVVAAMNAGLDACRGELIALTDDDAAPRPDWLARIVAVYASDSRIAAVGGRDWVYSYGTGRLLDGAEPVVGVIGRFGRVTGNHHMGVGGARDVDVLKGANLSVRAELLRQVRFDERLRGIGTEHHWELGLCLALRRRGLRIVYDPAIAVDHYPQPRVDDSREFSPRELRDARHNETVALLEHLPAFGRGLHILWAGAIGTSSTPGLAHLARLLPMRDIAGWSRFRGAQAGLIDGLRTYRRSRRARSDSAQSPPAYASSDGPRNASSDGPRNASSDAPRYASSDAPSYASSDGPRYASSDAPPDIPREGSPRGGRARPTRAR